MNRIPTQKEPSMYDHAKAAARGLVTSCTARLQEPVMLSGIYRCAKGHCHRVGWRHGHPVVNQLGYDASFLAALDAAETAASALYDPLYQEEDYTATYRAVLVDCGYQYVLPD